MTDKYILEGKTPVPCDNLLEWGNWLETADRCVAKTRIGDIEISTVFLGLDHRFSGDGKPLLFETMVFGGEHDGEMDRYSTWEQAEKGHQKIVEKVKGGIEEK